MFVELFSGACRSTYSLRRCRRQKRTAFSSPLLSTALAAPAAGGAITSVYLPRWWTHTRRLQRHTFIPLCAPTAPVDSSSLAAPDPSMLGPLFPTMFVRTPPPPDRLLLDGNARGGVDAVAAVIGALTELPHIFCLNIWSLSHTLC